MRILHVITSLGTGGAERLMVDLLPRLRDLGNDVSLLLFDGTRTAFYDELEQSGIKISSLSQGGNVYDIRYIDKLRKILPQYDIVHTHNTACQYFVSLARRLSRCKTRIVTTEHNTFNRRREYPLLRHVDRVIYRKYDAIIAISDKTRENLTAFVGNDFPISIINNGIDLSPYANFKPNFPQPEEDVIVTMIAAFRPQKDQDTLLKAIALLPTRYKLWLLGDGERRGELETLADSLGIKGRVTFWGNQKDVPSFIRQSNIMVLSSHWEGLSLSLLEAMASRRPMIVSDVDGLRDIAGGVAVTVGHEDTNELADAITRLATDENHYRQISDKCRTEALRYDIGNMAEAYNKLYHSL